MATKADDLGLNNKTQPGGHYDETSMAVHMQGKDDDANVIVEPDSFIIPKVLSVPVGIQPPEGYPRRLPADKPAQLFPELPEGYQSVPLSLKLPEDKSSGWERNKKAISLSVTIRHPAQANLPEVAVTHTIPFLWQTNRQPRSEQDGVAIPMLRFEAAKTVEISKDPKMKAQEKSQGDNRDTGFWLEESIAGPSAKYGVMMWYSPFFYNVRKNTSAYRPFLFDHLWVNCDNRRSFRIICAKGAEVRLQASCINNTEELERYLALPRNFSPEPVLHAIAEQHQLPGVVALNQKRAGEGFDWGITHNTPVASRTWGLAQVSIEERDFLLKAIDHTHFSLDLFWRMTPAELSFLSAVGSVLTSAQKSNKQDIPKQVCDQLKRLYEAILEARPSVKPALAPALKLDSKESKEEEEADAIEEEDTRLDQAARLEHVRATAVQAKRSSITLGQSPAGPPGGALMTTSYDSSAAGNSSAAPSTNQVGPPGRGNNDKHRY